MTSVVEFPDRTALEQEAATWIAKLDTGALSREDLRALRTWALKSSRHRSVLEAFVAGWDMLDILVLMRPAELAAAKFDKRWQLGGAALAAGLTIVAVAIGLLLIQPDEEAGALDAANLIHSTAIGQQRSVTLPDGSSIWINTNSRLHVEYSEERRGIFLHQGEAFFDVAKSERPFVVAAGNSQVTAIGTAFAVRVSYNNDSYSR